MYHLLGVGTNAKTTKGDGSQYLTAILYMKPELLLCPMSEVAGCSKACLYTAGRGAFSNVQAARTRKAMLYKQDRNRFNTMLSSDLVKFQRYCTKRGIQPVVRLNGTTDIDFIDIIKQYPIIWFYDYLKVYNRLNKKLPNNYHITLSYSEANMVYADKVVDMAKLKNVNVAVVFRSPKDIPKEFRGMSVIDGDKDDLRFLDANDKPYVVALYAKGKAKHDTSGFVIN